MSRMIFAGLCTAAVVIGLVWTVVVANAATWTVEKDGSGDFTVIQDAIDAASPGDVIQVGPGRFDDLQVNSSLFNGVQVAMIAWVNKPGLILQGSGAESTFVGPATYVGEFESESTGSVVVDSGSSCTIRDMTIENTRFEVTLYATSLMEDCIVKRSLFRNEHSVFVGYNVGTTIRRVEFFDSGGVVTNPGVSDLLIEDCTFEDSSDWTFAIQFSSSPQNVTVRRCTISGGATGIQSGGTGLIEDCTVSGAWASGLAVGSGGHMIARRCVFGPSRSTLWVSIGLIEVYDSVIEGGTRETIASTAEIYIRNSHILNGGGLSVDGATSVGDERIDVRHNWWGTSDPAQIEAWISDRFGTVLWEPFNDMPVKSRDSSMGRLKAGFGSN